MSTRRLHPPPGARVVNLIALALGTASPIFKHACFDHVYTDRRPSTSAHRLPHSLVLPSLPTLSIHRRPSATRVCYPLYPPSLSTAARPRCTVLAHSRVVPCRRPRSLAPMHVPSHLHCMVSQTASAPRTGTVIRAAAAALLTVQCLRHRFDTHVTVSFLRSVPSANKQAPLPQHRHSTVTAPDPVKSP